MATFIFLCNATTEKECLDRRLLGTPDGPVFETHLSKVAVGDDLLLYNYETGILYGPFTALTACRSNLEPKAFRGARVRPVWQVRVNPTKRYPVPLTADELNDLGLLHLAPKIGPCPPARLDSADYDKIMQLYKRKS